MGEYEDNYVIGFRTTRPGERIIGRALTIRSLPSRPDLKRALDTLGEEGDWDTRFYVRAGEEAKPGDVVVVEDEAMLFFPPEILDQVVQGARARQELEDYERNLLKEKKYRIRDVYPLHPELRKEYEAKKKKTTENPEVT